MTTVPPRTAPLAAAACSQAVLLAALAAGTGLGPAGVLVGAGYGLGLVLLLDGAARRAGAARLGPADLVTLARAVLVGGVAALVADGLAGHDAPVVPLLGLTLVALVLDGVDGQVARRTRTASALGARFDMETDSVLVLVLSVHAAALVGPWVLAIGAMRYAFVLAGRAAPWLRGPLPARYSTKAVAVLQGVALVVVAAGVLPLPVAAALLSTALAFLVWSFGRDVLLLRRAAVPARPSPARAATLRLRALTQQ